MPFFVKDREHLFGPLTWASKEAMVSVIKAVYERLYGPEAAFNRLFDRVALMEVVNRALAQYAAPADTLLTESDDSMKTTAEAAWFVRKLQETGWLEVYTDSVSVQKAWRLTPPGKRFARVLWELDRRSYNPRQRNMRSCANSLAAYLDRGDADDLLDARSYAEQVLEDLSNDIESFRLLVREATRDALAGRANAVGEFMDFVTERFRKEFGTRLVADSAERLKMTIIATCELIRELPQDTLLQYESQLRDRVMGEEARRGGQLILRIAERIEQLVRGACDTKLPELHDTIQNYISRRMSLIRQSLSARTGENMDANSAAAAALAPLLTEDKDALLTRLALIIAPVRIRLYEPKTFRFEIETPESEVTAAGVDVVVDPQHELDAEILRRQEEYLAITEEATAEYLREAIRNHRGRVRLSELIPGNARELLFVLAAGSIVDSRPDLGLVALSLPTPADTLYFTTPDIEFRLSEIAS